jgi:hypothetical protein
VGFDSARNPRGSRVFSYQSRDSFLEMGIRPRIPGIPHILLTHSFTPR